MEHLLDRLGGGLHKLRIGNVAIATGLLLMPLVLAAGFLTDRNLMPGHGISARAGLQAALSWHPPGARKNG